MKTLFILLLAVSLSAFAQAQNPPSGLTITAKQQKIAGATDARGPSKETQLDIEVFNTLPTTNSFNLDVFFIGTFNPGKDAQRFIRKSKKFQPSLQPMEKQTFSADSVPRQNQQPRKETNDFYPAGSRQFSTSEGYIIRASSGRTPPSGEQSRTMKVIASSPDLERLAKDPEKMQLLESGKTVPLK